MLVKHNDSQYVHSVVLVEKKKFRPINPYFSRHVTVNTTFFFLSNWWLDLYYTTFFFCLIDDWISATNNSELIGTILLDLSKAFDLVDHNI